ncbi:YceI family protein [Mangrovimonas sp. TPBH4]|uniref:YceI family protein n=1 Tax=Mangrovimonas sp. TPBH4 TaxID=1645914 RepID=UPI0006B5E5C6|nr:YceI family protein [Mangrovimonas sp. TPBH4]
MKKVIYSVALIGLLVSCKSETKKETEPIVEETAQEIVEVEKKPSIKDVDFTWTAFKTPAKAGVNGTFSEIAYGELTEADVFEDKFKGLTFKMDKTTVSTGDAARDTTLKNEFFAQLVGDISGRILEVKDGKAQLEIKLNDKTINKEFSFVPAADGQSVTFEGSVDLLEDFGANTAFDALHAACNALHEGKTWTDVNLKAVVSLQ